MTGQRIVVTGTDTDVGKTCFAMALADAIGATYWKPVQAGRGEDMLSDMQRTMMLMSVPALPEAYDLKTPCSPHMAARLDGVEIDPAALALPEIDEALVIEGAGGVLVPLTDTLLYADLFAQWGAPVVLVARTSLGTINHTLLSLEALRARDIAVLGVAFVGNADEVTEESERIICDLGKARRLGRLPFVQTLSHASLSSAFAENFELADFAA